MKIKIQTLSISVFVILFMSVSNLALAQVSYKLDSKKSSMVIKGTSTIHDWEMNVESVNGALTLQKDNDLSKLSSGNLEVDVKSIKSDHSLMNKKTYSALKKDEYPQITAKLLHVDPADGSVDLKITIAGKTKELKDNFKMKQEGSGAFEITGSLNIKMSDFDVEPPVALMGTISTGNEVSIDYKLFYEKAGQVYGSLVK